MHLASLLYKFLPLNLGACKPMFCFFLYTTSEEIEYYEALFLSYRPLQNAVFHNFSRQITFIQYSGPSKHAWTFNQRNRSKNFQNHLYGQPVLTFDKRQICEEILRVTLQRDKEFIESIFYSWFYNDV